MKKVLYWVLGGFVALVFLGALVGKTEEEKEVSQENVDVVEQAIVEEESNAKEPNPDGLDDILGDDYDTSQPVKMEESEDVSREPTNPERNIALVVKALSDAYGINAEYNFGDKFCPNQNYCEAIADGVQVQAIGYKVSALTSTTVPPATYQKVCASILYGLSGAHLDLVEQSTVAAFNFAAQNNGAKATLGKVDVSVTPRSNGLLECSYVLVR